MMLINSRSSPTIRIGWKTKRIVILLLALLKFVQSEVSESAVDDSPAEAIVDVTGNAATRSDYKNEDWLSESQTNETLETDSNEQELDAEDEEETRDDSEIVDELEHDTEEIDPEHPVEEGPGSAFGVVQEVGGELASKLLEALENTLQYMERIWEDEAFTKVWKLCRNEESQCTFWSLTGECESNPDFMSKSCAPACQTCHVLHYETRCAMDPNDVDAWQPGDLNQMFEKILADPKNNVTVISRPNFLPGDNQETANYHVGPWVLFLDHFLNKEEAQRLVDLGTRAGYERSLGVGEIDESTGEFEDVVDQDRTSTNAWCHEECQRDPMIVQVLQRLEALTGIPTENSESLQLLKYEEGQYYNTHHDYLDHEQFAMQGPRILTAFMYLSDVEEGGETRFDWLNAKVAAKTGRVVLWPSVLDEDPSQIDDRTEHEAMPVVRGIKYAANAWIHLRNVKKAEQLGC